MQKFTCFKTYDVRGKIGFEIDESIVYRIGRAAAQHLKCKSVVIGFDARETSPAFAKAVAEGVKDAGAVALNIGLCGTEEMYWAVNSFCACAGIEVTASHNPIDYNGLKIVKSGSKPLHELHDFQTIKTLAETESWIKTPERGECNDVSTLARTYYVNRVLSFINIDNLKPLKIVVNSGNGAAGPTFDAIAAKLAKQNAPIEFKRVHHDVDHNFPNGIPNPLLPENHAVTGTVVKDENADFGIAFDGDFDRCFFFDESGDFIPGEYVVGLLASIFLKRERSAKIVHDPRLIWNTQDIASKHRGKVVQSKTGHVFVKQKMREEGAVYGGEISAHHYFRDFAYSDSGMIPWLLITELVSSSGYSLKEWVSERYIAFPSSGERNFIVDDAEIAIDKVVKSFKRDALSLDYTDGVSLGFKNWRFNLRQSNTEPLVRLNVESRGDAMCVSERVEAIAKILGGTAS